MIETALAGRHSMNSQEWFTPEPIVEMARELMKSIDLDPASSHESNRIVQAGEYYTKTDNGLALGWYGRVFVNAPGGLVKPFWQALVYAFEAGNVTEAVWVGYSLEQLQTLQGLLCQSPLAFPMCVPSKRIAFIESAEAKAARKERWAAKNIQLGLLQGKPLKPWNDKGSPSHGNYLTYLGPQVERFREIFGRIGVVR